MSCPSCHCHRCRNYYRNPAPRGASAWASHMDAPPAANEGPATSLETSMTEHFLGPMRNPYWLESTDERIMRMVREYMSSPTQELYDKLMRTIARTGRPVEYYAKDGIRPPLRENPWGDFDYY